MSPGAQRSSRTLEVAETVADVLAARGAESAVIGAVALAAHGYVRATRDFDLATFTDPFSRLREAKEVLERSGFRAELRSPDAEDPLGGVLDIQGEGFQPIQVVNYLNPLAPRVSDLGLEAVREAQPGLLRNSRLRVVTLPFLIALKLYAGGAKSRADVAELLERQERLDLKPIRDVARRFGLVDEFERVVAELGR